MPSVMAASNAQAIGPHSKASASTLDGWVVRIVGSGSLERNSRRSDDTYLRMAPATICPKISNI
jgi:hypothetical protein